MYCVKSEDVTLFSKNVFESITFDKKENIKLIDFFLSLPEIQKSLFQKSCMLEIRHEKSGIKRYHLKLLKITKLEDNKYYCQYKALGETHD